MFYNRRESLPLRSSSTKISREARRRNQIQVDNLVDSNGMKSSVGTRRVEEILQRCSYLASKRGQDLHVLRKTLKEDEEKIESEKIAQRLSMYFASLSNNSTMGSASPSGGGGPGNGTGRTENSSCSGGPGGPCSCFHIADWPSLENDYMLIDHPDMDSDDIDDDDEEDDLADELYSTVYLGGTSDWAKKTDHSNSNNNNSHADSTWSNHVVGY